MKGSSSKLSPLLRFAAVGVLLLWVAAVTACSTECLEDSHSESGQMKSMTAASPSHDSNKQDGHDDSFCDSLHSLCPTTSSSVLVKPDFGLAFTLDLILPTQLVELAQPETPVSCQPPDTNRAVTHEVSLGAAFYSLAPPILA